MIHTNILAVKEINKKLIPWWDVQEKKQRTVHDHNNIKSEGSLCVPDNRKWQKILNKKKTCEYSPQVIRCEMKKEKKILCNW